MNGPVPVRDAATIVLIRDRATRPAVLMGQRGTGAVFMPSKYVFPGGAVDPNDAEIDVGPVPALEAERLALSSALSPQAICAAAIRELWEETGLILGRRADWPDAPRGWRGFAASGHRPDARGLRFIFRAVTPPGQPRRFDARFLLAEAEALASDPDDFSRAEDELGHLHWVPLDEARALDLPFITEVVLAELKRGTPGPPPWFRDDDEVQLMTRLEGASPLG